MGGSPVRLATTHKKYLPGYASPALDPQSAQRKSKRHDGTTAECEDRRCTEDEVNKAPRPPLDEVFLKRDAPDGFLRPDIEGRVHDTVAGDQDDVFVHWAKILPTISNYQLVAS